MVSSTGGQTFDINSLSLDAGHDLNVTIQGLLAGNVIYSWTGIIPNQYAYTDVGLNWVGIDTLSLSGGANLFVTNIDVPSNVPEPESLSLLALGLLAVVATRRKAKQL